MGELAPEILLLATDIVCPSSVLAGSVFPLSCIDNLAAPYRWVRVAFAFNDDLDVTRLKISLAQVLDALPCYAGRVKVDKAGNYELYFSAEGAVFNTGSCATPLASILPPKSPEPYTSVDLSAALPDLPVAIMTVASESLPVLHTTAISCSGGGTILAAAIHHLISDWKSMATFFTCWAACYSCRKLPEGAMLASQLLEASMAPHVPHGYVPHTFVPLADLGPAPAPQPEGGNNKATEDRGANVTYHVSAARLAELKAEAAKFVQEHHPGEWVSSNDALIARIWQVTGALQRRRGVPLCVTVPMNIRDRLSPPLPPASLGCLVVPAQTDSLDTARLALGELALQCRRGLNRTIALLPEDLRWGEGQREGGFLATFTLRGPSRDGTMTSPTGPMMISQWPVDYDALTFTAPGPAPGPAPAPGPEPLLDLGPGLAQGPASDPGLGPAPGPAPEPGLESVPGPATDSVPGATSVAVPGSAAAADGARSGSGTGASGRPVAMVPPYVAHPGSVLIVPDADGEGWVVSMGVKEADARELMAAVPVL